MSHLTMTRTTPIALATLVVGVLLAAGGSYLFAAWSGPTQTPPNGNVEAPVNVGPVGQEKLGMFAALGGVFRNGGLSINTSLLSDGSASPNGAALKLDVEGAVGATKYCDENGENCFTARGGGGGSKWVAVDLDGKDFWDRSCQYRVELDVKNWGPMKPPFTYQYTDFAGTDPVVYAHLVSSTKIVPFDSTGIIGYISHNDRRKYFWSGNGFASAPGIYDVIKDPYKLNLGQYDAYHWGPMPVTKIEMQC